MLPELHSVLGEHVHSLTLKGVSLTLDKRLTLRVSVRPPAAPAQRGLTPSRRPFTPVLLPSSRPCGGAFFLPCRSCASSTSLEFKIVDEVNPPAFSIGVTLCSE